MDSIALWLGRGFMVGGGLLLALAVLCYCFDMVYGRLWKKVVAANGVSVIQKALKRGSQGEGG